MYDALNKSTLQWTEAVTGLVAGATVSSMDMSTLARLLATSAHWDGCPRATELPPPEQGYNYRRLPLREASTEMACALLIAWPAGVVSSLHDHDGQWGIEVVLDGVLELESFALAEDTPYPLPWQSRLLGPGDYSSFPGSGYAHRCSNPAENQAALTLHVYGKRLDRFRSFQRTHAGWATTLTHATSHPPLLA